MSANARASSPSTRPTTWVNSGSPGRCLVPPPPVEQVEFHQRTQVPLAKEKVRHAGEAVVMVIAESRYLAEDALEEIFVEYEPLDAVVDLESSHFLKMRHASPR